MKQYIQQLLKDAISNLQAQKKLPDNLSIEIQIEQTRDIKHGDYASNLALMLAKTIKTNPRQLAELIINALPHSNKINKIEIAGAGFINFFVASTAHQEIVAEIIKQRDSFGKCNLGQGKKVILEFTSANPTGPLHVGHGRGAIFGATLADLLELAGYTVHREYYVNDAGRQISILTVSVWLRYLELHGMPITFPNNAYHGDYVKNIAQALSQQYQRQFIHHQSDVWHNIPLDGPDNAAELHIDALIVRAKELLGKDYDTIHDFSVSSMLNNIKRDLGELGVYFNNWFSEQNELVAKGLIADGIEALKRHGYVYLENDALWFSSTKFGDEKDRVLIRANGEATYFASDVAYHLNKLQRGFDIIIDILGADHHGYIPRVRAAIEALGFNKENLYFPIVQFATLYRGKEKVIMSKRTGSFVTLRDLCEEIGKDAVRFFYSMRKADQHMDFDLELAKSKTNENPVYYVQYAHARICSVFRQLIEKGWSFDETSALQHVHLLDNEHEKSLLMHLSAYPEMIMNAAKHFEPHQIVNYLRLLANLFHSYYNAHQIIVPENNLRDARLSLINAVKQVLLNGLTLLGISAPETM